MAAPAVPSQWVVVNDTVMGGRSSGWLEKADEGSVAFSGVLSLENNGGFASIRSRSEELEWDDASSIKIRVLGDGRTWTVNLYRRDVPLRAGGYRAMFATRAQGVTEVELPLAVFSPTSFGRPVPGLPTLDSAPEQINQVGFLLGDKQAGPFSLTVLSMDVLTERSDRGPGGADVWKTFQEAIALGVPLFNDGAVAACRDVYRDALDDMAQHPALTPGERLMVAETLQSVDKLGADGGAWALRYAMDTVLAGMGSPNMY
jgi:monofunctional biosynthetic peptidoglycan transglycosylase